MLVSDMQSQQVSSNKRCAMLLLAPPIAQQQLHHTAAQMTAYKTSWYDHAKYQVKYNKALPAGLHAEPAQMSSSEPSGSAVGDAGHQYNTRHKTQRTQQGGLG